MANPKPQAQPKPGLSDDDELDAVKRALATTAPAKPEDNPAWQPIPFIARNLQSALGSRGWRDSLCDSRLVLFGAENALLTLTLRIFFERVDPTDKGGRRTTILDGDGHPYMLAEISDQDFYAFRKYACDAANRTWNSLCLVTPNDFAGFDWPLHSRNYPSYGTGIAFTGPNIVPSPDFAVNLPWFSSDGPVRPNVNCLLQCEMTEKFSDKHAWVRLVLPTYHDPKHGEYRSFTSTGFTHYKTIQASVWSIKDDTDKHKTAKQDPACLWFMKEQLSQSMAPHEIGHLLGLQHIGLIMKVRNCLYPSAQCSDDIAEDTQYGNREDLPMWWARDIMGLGNVVHACNASPWITAIAQHTNTNEERWIPAGVRIPPRALKDIPKQPYTWQNSPYQGGFQEVGRY